MDVKDHKDVRKVETMGLEAGEFKKQMYAQLKTTGVLSNVKVCGDQRYI